MAEVSQFSRRDALLLFAGAWLLRLAAVSAVPATPSEGRLLGAAYSPDRPAALAARGTDLTSSLLAMLRPLAAPAPDIGPPAPAPAGPVGLRVAFACLGALAAAAAGAAGGTLGGRATGWIAGGLLALAPFALRSSIRVDSAGPVLAATAGALWLLVRLARGPTPWRALGAGTLTGLAAAASPGAAALAVGWPLAARGVAAALAIPAAVLLMAAGAPATFRVLVDPAAGAPWPAATGLAGSPLLAGVRAVAGLAGIPALALACAGAVAAARRGLPADRACLAAIAGAFLGTLLLGGTDPQRLAVALPGVFLLAAFCASDQARLPGIGARPAVRRALALVVLAWALAGSAPIVAGRWTATPESKARAWVERNVSTGSPMLVEGRFRLPAAIELPARGASDEEALLFYEPNVAQLFEWILLEKRPAGGEDSAPSQFHAWVGGTYDAVARFDSIDPSLGSATMFRRPPGFVHDPDSALPLVRILGGPGASAVRDTSRAFTDWVLRAGVAFRAAGQARAAEGLLELAATRDSTDARARYELGLALLLLEETAEAKAAFLAALDGDPFHGGTHYNLGTILESEGDARGAEVEYLAAIAHLDDPSPAHARLGAMLAREGNVPGARAHLAELVARDPEGEAAQFLAEAVVAAEAAP